MDCFTVGGHGGSGKDTSNTGVRITHLASGAVGKATDTRSQSKNRQLAFRRMGESGVFRLWVQGVVSGVDKKVKYWMSDNNLKVETRNHDGKWVEIE